MTEIDIQRFRGLLASWRNRSEYFKNKGDYSSADVVDSCMAELEATLFTMENILTVPKEETRWKD